MSEPLKIPSEVFRSKSGSLCFDDLTKTMSASSQSKIPCPCDAAPLELSWDAGKETPLSLLLDRTTKLKGKLALNFVEIFVHSIKK